MNISGQLLLSKDIPVAIVFIHKHFTNNQLEVIYIVANAICWLKPTWSTVWHERFVKFKTSIHHSKSDEINLGLEATQSTITFFFWNPLAIYFSTWFNICKGLLYILKKWEKSRDFLKIYRDLYVEKMLLL